MQRITEVMDPATGEPTPDSERWLRAALFRDAALGLAMKGPIGQFLPGAAGGANSTAGFGAPSAVNPWDFILMIEGALLFAAASVKRLESADDGSLVYPFCVRQAGVGYASAAAADEAEARCEMWMPLWDQPTTLPELRAILTEGRAQVRGRAARNGVDFALAAVTLGVDRGISAFQRYGFQVRNGLSYFATPLERVVVRRNARAELLADIKQWHERLRQKAGPKANPEPPASVARALNQLERRIVELCQDDSPSRLQALLRALGATERSMAKSFKWTTGAYLGRAEGLVTARVLEAIPEVTNRSHSIAAPLSNSTPRPERTELVRLLAPWTPEQYGAWRSEFLATNAAPAAHTAKKRKKVKGDAAKNEPLVPLDLFEALHADTGKLQAAGWNLPPGATFVNYTRREEVFAPATRPRATRKGPLPTVARYAVVSAVAPRIRQAISIGERVHDALCKWSDQGKGRATVFTGLDEHGNPGTNHQHAHIFCEANDPRDAVTHITVWAPMGLDEAACLALRRLNKVWGHGGHDIHLVLHGIGQAAEFKQCPLLGTATAWRSITPFVSTRHAKTFRDGRPKIDDNGWQHGSAPHDLLRLLALNSAWPGATIRRLDERAQPFAFGDSNLRSLQFQTNRREGAGKRGQNRGAAFQIEFPEPVRGPIALGYGAHFGLGLFVPATPHDPPAAIS